jgi:alcohol dehydrogenase class IV
LEEKMRISPYLAFAPGSIQILPNIVRRICVRKPLVIYSKFVLDQKSIVRVLNNVRSATDVSVFSDFTPNPKIDDLLRAVTYARTRDVDGVVSIGGGTAIDLGKMVAALLHETGTIRLLVNQQVPLQRKYCPVVAIPTTAGSGAEATPFAVLYIGETKYSVTGSALLPDIAILDPELSCSMSPQLTAASGFDVLAQAIESLWSVRATGRSRQLALAALRLAWQNIITAANAPTPDARSAMLKAANLAGQAIAISQTTAPHALSYYFTAKHNIPHGHAVGLSLGRFLTLNWQLGSSSLGRCEGSELRKILLEIYSAMGVSSSRAAEEQLYNLMSCIGLEWRLTNLGISRHEETNILRSVNIARLCNHPVKLSRESVRGAFHW